MCRWRLPLNEEVDRRGGGEAVECYVGAALIPSIFFWRLALGKTELVD